MNPNEAIQVLVSNNSSQNDRKQASLVLREAADYRTVKKPICETVGGYSLCNCPTCGRDVYSYHGFCRYCGQAIDWS